VLFGGHRGDAFRHPDAEIDDAARRQLERAAARDDLALVELERLDAVHRHALPAGEGVTVGGTVGLDVIGGVGDDEAIDQNAGDLYLARIERIAGGDALDLDAHKTARVFRRHRHGEIVQRQRLALHGDIARRIGGRPAQQRDIVRKGFVAKPLLVIDPHQLDEVFGLAFVELAALQARSTNVLRPTLVITPGPRAAMLR
jgi:hypothetical protein